MMSVAINRKPKNAAEDMHINKHSFANSFRPIYYFSRLFGLLPWSINYDSKRQVQGPRLRVFDVLWFLMFICGYLLMAYNSYHRMTVNQNSVTVLIFGGHMHVILKFIFGISAMGMDLCNRHKIVYILKMFNDFDKNVSKICY